MISTCAPSLRVSSATIAPRRSTAALLWEGDSVSKRTLRRRVLAVFRIYLVIYRWGTDHQRFNRGFNMDDRMPLTRRKTTEFSWTNAMNLSIHFHMESALQDEKNLISFFVIMKRFRCINPCRASIVVPNL